MSAKPARDILFGEVTRDHHGLIGRIALSYEADPAIRRELMQDILLAIWLALDSWRGEASLKTFVASIAQKRSISHVTRAARQPRQESLPVDLPCAAPMPDEAAIESERRRQLVECIQELPIPQREAIVLSFEGFSHQDVADVLGISVNAATLRVTRARAALKALMERRV